MHLLNTLNDDYCTAEQLAEVAAGRAAVVTPLTAEEREALAPAGPPTWS